MFKILLNIFLLFIVSTNANKYSTLLVSDEKPLPSLHVLRNKFSYLKRIHLPIPTKVQQGHVCAIEVELNSPFYCSAGCLQPKKFSCSFNDGDVIYFHNGNPQINQDKVRVTIYYSRDNHSILQSVDLNVNIDENAEEETTTNDRGDQDFYFNSGKNLTLMNQSYESSFKSYPNQFRAIQDIKDAYQPFKSRLKQLKELSVKTLRGVTEAISPNILSVKYDENMEECYLNYYHKTKTTAWQEKSDYLENVVVNAADKMGQSSQRLSNGDANEWPIFGNLIAFNRSIVNSFSMSCKVVLLKGFRYIHRNIESPNLDYLPLEVNIYRRNFDGSKQLVSKQGIFLKIKIASINKMRNPIIKAPREINLVHLGGTFSILPKDSLMVPINSVPSEEYISVNITRIDGNFNRQFVNLRDPSREIFSFTISDLRAGLIAFQLLDYAEQLIKTFRIHLQPVDPFFHKGETIILTLSTHLRSPIHKQDDKYSKKNMAPFQIFTLPLFTHTGAKTNILHHNIQTIGYLDDKHVAILVIRNFTSWPVRYPFIQIPRNPVGKITINGHSYEDQLFVFQQVESNQVVYETARGFSETIDRVKLSILIKSTGYIDLSRRRRNVIRPTTDLLPKDLHSPLFELPVRMFRLYNHIDSSVLKSNYKTEILHRSYKCFTSEDLILPEALAAIRDDQVNLKFRVTNKPTQGILVRLSTLPSYGQNAQELADGYRSSLEKGMTNIPPYYDQSTIYEFTLEDLEDSEICYINQRDDREFDLFGIKQIGNPNFQVFYFELIVKKSVHMILKMAMNPSVILQTQDTANFVLITPMHLKYEIRDPNEMFAYDSLKPTKEYSPKDIIYRITKMPYFIDDSNEGPRNNYSSIRDGDAGRIISLSEVQASDHVGDTNLQSNIVESLRNEQPPVTTQFTQAQIDSGDIVYVPPNEDIGFNVKNVILEYSVSVPDTLGMFEKQLKIRILPEDNIAPEIITKYSSLNATRDGELILNEKYFEFKDLDTDIINLNVTFSQIPKFGRLLYFPQNNYIQEQVNFDKNWNMEQIQINQTIPVSAFYQAKIIYRQSGINVKEDSFEMSVSDGRQKSEFVSVLINISQRVIEIPNWLKFVNNSLVVEENSTVILHESIFPGAQEDSGNKAITDNVMRFIVVVKPTRGKIMLNKDREISQFSMSNLRSEKISYSHGPGEIGWKKGNDYAKLYDIKTGKDFTINFSLSPVNSQRPELKREGVLQVKEGGSSVLTTHHVSIHDADTPKEHLTFQLVSPPKWGQIIVQNSDENFEDTTTIENHETLLEKIVTFSVKELKAGQVHYVNGEHSKGVEVTDDIFTLKAIDDDFSSEPVYIQVVIQSTNDEKPYVRMLRTFSVPLGKQRVLTPHLFTFSDSDIPRDSLEVSFPKLPIYGDLYQYWRHGEKNIINSSTGPMLQSYLELLNIVYIQAPDKIEGNKDLNVVDRDYFTVQVSDGFHNIQKNATILIRRENNKEPTIKLKNDGLILDGIYWKSLNDAIEVNDLDTLPEDLEIIIDSEPRLGKFKRMPRMDFDQNLLEDEIEAAWDREEEEALKAGHTQKSMTAAGSIGGPKTEKFLFINDRFTKRQLNMNRVHYVYNKNFTTEFIEDSCYLSVTDGKFTSNRIELKIKIRMTNGYLLQQSVQKSRDFINLKDNSTSETFDFVHDEAPAIRKDYTRCFNDAITLGQLQETTISLVDIINDKCKDISEAYTRILMPEFINNNSTNFKENCFNFTYNGKLKFFKLNFNKCKNNFNIFLQMQPQDSMTPEIIKIPVVVKQFPISIKGETPSLFEIFPNVDINFKANTFALSLNRSHINEDDIRFIPDNSEMIRIYKRLYTNDGIEIQRGIRQFSLSDLKNGSIWYANNDEDQTIFEKFLNFQVLYKNQRTGLVKRIKILYSFVPELMNLTPSIISPLDMLEMRPRKLMDKYWFILKPNNLYQKDKNVVYSLIGNHENLQIYNLKSRKNITHFSQEEVNTFLIALLITGDVNKNNESLHLKLQPSRDVDKGASFELNIEWTNIGFEKKYHIVCEKDGTILMALYVNKTQIGSPQNGQKFKLKITSSNLHSGVKIEHDGSFNIGSAVHKTFIPVNVTIGSFKSESKRITFKISCQPMSNCLVGRDTTDIIITKRKECRDRKYFRPFDKSHQREEPMQSDQGFTQQMVKEKLLGINLAEYMRENNYTSLQQMISDLMKLNSKKTKGFCPNNWEKLNDRCYEYIRLRKPVNWFQAQKECTKRHGYLVSIRSTEEQNWLRHKFHQLNNMTKRPVFTWIGLYKSDEFSQWTWDNGNYLHGYENWIMRGSKHRGPSHCALIQIRGNEKWRKVNCNLGLRNLICMRNLIE